MGANNFVACITTTGQQYLYEGQNLFDRFRETTEKIARLRFRLCEGKYSSHRVRRLYRRRMRRRDHAQDALVRDLMERLYAEGVATVYVGDLTDVLSMHWRRGERKDPPVLGVRGVYQAPLIDCRGTRYHHRDAVRRRYNSNMPGVWRTKRHQPGRRRISVSVRSRSPRDLRASRMFLGRQVGEEVGSMARPVRLTWDDHTGQSHHTLPRGPVAMRSAQTGVPATGNLPP